MYYRVLRLTKARVQMLKHILRIHENTQIALGYRLNASTQYSHSPIQSKYCFNTDFLSLFYNSNHPHEHNSTTQPRH
jgi:hypothetical protein